MRASVYGFVSTALAGATVGYAFAQRPNFYSACVFLSQSNLSVMILINLCLLVAYSIVWAFSRLLYGPLRPIEVEQLYERGWFTVTETCLAMTIFRDEIGAWFIAMFVALMAGRVWGWIGQGRVEMLEQQPPANPRSFHTRLVLSLLVSLAYDFAFVSYTATTVYEQARPNMMVMFLFEYVLLTISTVSTALRYLICVVEIRIHQKQAQQMLQARRAEIRERGEEILRQRQERGDTGEISTGGEEPLPSEDDIDEMDIEPPGWEGKGLMILILDLLSDFVRLLVYLGFFAVLTTFFGLPIHIMRDLFMTSRSFVKRLNAMLRYRNATRDMNARYPDATQAEIADNDTCIICREDMRPWSLPDNAEDERRVDARPVVPISERHRSKKLPCGHVLHLGCLKSWLERQQVCPTCRAPVSGQTLAQAQPAVAAGRLGGAGAQPHPLAGGRPQQGQQPPAVPNNGVRGGMINLGPLRVAYGRAVVPGNVNPAAAQEAARQAMMAQAGVPPGARVFGLEFGNVPAPANRTPLQGWRQPHPAVPVPTTSTSTQDIGQLIRSTEQRIMEEAEKLKLQEKDLKVLKRMQQELCRHKTVDKEERTLRQDEASGAPAVPTTMQGGDNERVSTPQQSQHHAETESGPSDVLDMNQEGASAPNVPTTTSDGNAANQPSPPARYESPGTDVVVSNQPGRMPSIGDVEEEDNIDTRTVATPKQAIPTRNENVSSDGSDGTQPRAGSGAADAARDDRSTA